MNFVFSSVILSMKVGGPVARKARRVELEGVYHIRQFGSSSRKLFESKEDKFKFLELIKASKKKYGYKLYAYCLENDNAYHLVVYANGSDLSKIMKSLNIAYAMYIKSDQPIFKDRYKSVLIEDECVFERICEEIRCNKVNGSCFNSEIDICDHDNPFHAACKLCLKTTKEALERLEQIACAKSLKTHDLIKDKSLRNQLIVDFRKNSILSLKELGELFGGLSESSVCKILKLEK